MLVSVETERLHLEKKEIVGLTEELKKQMQQIETLVLSVNGEWQGEAEAAFANKIIYVKNQFVKLTDFFEEYAKMLDQFATDYQKYDEDIASKIKLS